MERARKAAIAAARAEVLLEHDAGGIEAAEDDSPFSSKTYKATQKAIASSEGVGEAYAKKLAFSLHLPTYGPYCVNWSRNGRYALLCGQKGHVSVLDAQVPAIRSETHLEQHCRDACFLHDASFFAVAQRRYTHIYDGSGSEVHVMRDHRRPLALDFLPHHFLLATAGEDGFLRYRDTSTGALVAAIRTGLGPCHVLRQDPWTGVVGLGHRDGGVTLRTPAMTKPLMRIAAHRGPVTAAAFDGPNRLLVTAGSDSRVRIWDLRKTAENVVDYFTPGAASSLDVSQRGQLVVLAGRNVQVWGEGAMREKHKAPFLRHALEAGPGIVGAGPVRGLSARFRPFEDALLVGHNFGIEGMIAPGSGEPNYDALELNPYENSKARREREVRSLMDKIPAELISLDTDAITKVKPGAQTASSSSASSSGAAARAGGGSGKSMRMDWLAGKPEDGTAGDGGKSRSQGAGDLLDVGDDGADVGGRRAADDDSDSESDDTDSGEESDHEREYVAGGRKSRAGVAGAGGSLEDDGDDADPLDGLSGAERRKARQKLRKKAKKKQRGRSKTSRLAAKRQGNIWDENKAKLRQERLRKEAEKKAREEAKTAAIAKARAKIMAQRNEAIAAAKGGGAGESAGQHASAASSKASGRMVDTSTALARFAKEKGPVYLGRDGR